MERSALLLGASSQPGAELLPLLLSCAAYSSVTILTRTALLLQHKKLKQHIVDFDVVESYASLLTGDDIFYCMGTGTGNREVFLKVELDYSSQIAEGSLRNGSTQFFYLSAYGANEASKIFYLKVKGKAEKKLSILGYPSLHIFRPSMLSGNKDASRNSQRVFALLSRYLPFLFLGGLKKLRTLPTKILAEAMIKIALTDRRGFFLYDAERIRREASGAFHKQ